MDEVDFEVLFKESFAAISAWCQYKFDLDADSAKEVVHSAFIKLWDNRATLSPGLPAKSYLYKIVTNSVLDMLKHEKVKATHARFVAYKSPLFNNDCFEKMDVKELTADINKAISEMPEQMRKVFELSRYEGLKNAEISARLDISIKTVETQMSRALARLRQKLSQYLQAVIIAMLMNQ